MARSLAIDITTELETIAVQVRALRESAETELRSLSEGLSESIGVDWMNFADMADATTFDREDGTNMASLAMGGFNFRTAFAMAFARPSDMATAYVMEAQRRMIVAASRAFCRLNPYWMAVRQARIAYNVGMGHTYSFVARDSGEAVDKELARKAMQELNLFLKANKYRRRQGEKLTRGDRDGEYFLRLIEDRPDGILHVRFVEPIAIQNPPGEGPENGVWFGIKFNQFDYEEPIEYYVHQFSHDGATSEVETVPADKIQHRKFNVDMSSPRGIPTTYALRGPLTQALSTATSMGRLVDIRARIAVIRKQVNATLGQIQPLLLRNRSGQVTQGIQTRNAFQLPYGGFVDTNDQRTWEMPSQGLETDKIVHSVKTDLQSAAAALGFADFVLSADSGCHDTETELMTKRGWIRHDQIVYGDEAGTMNPDTGKFEWQAIQQVHKSQYDGEMIRLKNNHTLDMLVTPNHRMYAAKRMGGSRGKPSTYGKYGFVRADELIGTWTIPDSTKPKDGKSEEWFQLPGISNGYHIRTRWMREIPMNRWLAFLGWFIADGWTCSNKRSGGSQTYGFGINQSTKATQECEAISKAVACLPCAVSSRNSAGKSSVNGYDYITERRTWEMSDKGVWSWLRENCGAGSYHKQVPSFINDLPSQQQEIILDSAVLGDGVHTANKRRMYYTVSGKLADDMQTLAIQCGYFANPNKTMPNGVIPVSMGRNRSRIVIVAKHRSRVPYSGIVWCVTVPNGIIITRRNGKMAISGNSNFAGALVKEGPMDKSVGCSQAGLIEDDIEILERALQVAARAGRLSEDVLEKLAINVQAPNAIARNRIQDAQADEIYNRNGACSTETMCERGGFDPEIEMPRIKANPPPALVAAQASANPTGTGDTRSHQAPKYGKPTARGVPAGSETGPGANPQKAEEGLDEGAYEPHAQDKPTQAEIEMAAVLLTDEWLTQTRNEILALPASSGSPRDMGVRSEYEPGIQGVYLGVVDDQRVWAVDADAVMVKYDAQDFICAGNHERWPWVPANVILIDWSYAPSAMAHDLYHEAIETRLMAVGRWPYSMAHRMANAHEREWMLALRPELQTLVPA